MTLTLASRDHLRVGVGQMNSGASVEANLATIGDLAEAAAASGCGLLCLPENATLLAPDRERLRLVEPIDGAQITGLRDLARRLGLAIHVGSFAETGPDARHSYNTSVLIDADGVVVGTYRKMHLFDVDVSPDTRFCESATVAAGEARAVCGTVHGWKLGLSICYDLRFPELYRALVTEGAEVLLVPAAFTYRTGNAHWHALLRARAIENLAWVVAAGQTGTHYGSRESYGHSLVVSPWGELRVDAGARPGLQMADLLRADLDDARARIPALAHRRMA